MTDIYPVKVSGVHDLPAEIIAGTMKSAAFLLSIC